MNNVLQSRGFDKAAEAIKCCNQTQDSGTALETALEQLKIYFGDSTRVIEVHIASDPE